MSNYFKKYKKSATALALVFAISYPTYLSASHVSFRGQDIIDENADSIDDISGKFALSMRPPAADPRRDDPTQFVPLDVSYDIGKQVAKNNLKAVKNSVIQSPLLTYPELYEDHQNSFKQKIRTAYNDTSLAQCDNFLDHVRNFSVKLFKVSQNDLSNSKTRNEWTYDDTLGGFFTFTLNNGQKVSILVKDLNVVLPLYSNHRHPDLRSMAPWVEPQDGIQLTADQRITGQFINRILSSEIPGNPLKQAIKYRLQNKTMSLENLTKHMRGEDLPLVVQIDHYAERRKVFDKRYIDASLLPTIQKFYNLEPYRTYEAFTTNKGSGYKHGMNMNDYWKLWLNDSRYGKYAQKYVLPKYELPLDLIQDKQTYDRQFIETLLLPTIQKFYNYNPYKTYGDFIKPNNGSGYKIDMDINKYWDSWLNSRYGEVAKKYPLQIYKPPLI